MIQAVIFDMNGVLIDDEHLHELAFQKVCSSFGISLSHEDYLKWCAGRTDRDGFEEIITKHRLTKVGAAELMDRKSAAYLELIPGNIKSFSGSLELVKKLYGKYRLALTSSSSRKEIEMVLKTFAIKDMFEIIVSAEDVRKGKPDPEPYLLTAQKLGTAPERCWVVEDTRNGIVSAKAAGMRCVAVSTTHPKEDLVAADAVVEDFSGIEEAIEKFNAY